MSTKPMTKIRDLESVKEIPDEDGNTAFYIVNYEEGGFVIISADNRVKPILAYSDSDQFPLDSKTYPSGLIEWLSGTKDFIKNIRLKNAEQSPKMAICGYVMVLIGLRFVCLMTMETILEL